MKLNQIKDRIAQARKNLKEISPDISCYIVVMLGNSQFMPKEINATNVALLLAHDSLLDTKANAAAVKKANAWDILKRQCDYIRKNNLSDKNSLKTLSENEKKMSRIQAALIPIINTVEFVEPQCELRFGDLDMDKIQQIKRHPIVREIGKTSMSRASIRIVIG